MTPHNNYYIIAAETYDAHKRHHALVAEALKNPCLSASLRDRLEAELKRLLVKEDLARRAFEDEEIAEEEQRKKKEGSASGGDEGGGGEGQQGGSGGGGGVMVAQTDAVAEEASEDMLDFELLALLLFSDRNNVASTSVADDAQFMAAATLLFDKAEKTALVGEAYASLDEDTAHMPGDFLLSLEKHATDLGARALQLRVRADAVDQVKRRHGYEPLGKPVLQNGVRMQRMTKILSHAPVTAKNTPV